jgi:hypothetical protein
MAKKGDWRMAGAGATRSPGAASAKRWQEFTRPAAKSGVQRSGDAHGEHRARDAASSRCIAKATTWTLDRCRTQFKLVESITSQEDAMNELVASIAVAGEPVAELAEELP